MSYSKSVLILYTAVGFGHKTIAENIGRSLECAGYQVKLADIGKVQKGRFEKYVVAVHSFINRKLPFVWDWLYSWGHYIILPFRVFIAGFNYQATKAMVDEYHPGIIITTQTTASAVVAYLKQQGFYKGIFGVAFSDYHFHRYWLYDQADFYLANIIEQKKEMVDLGVPESKIFVTGFNLKPHETLNTSVIKEKLGIEPNKKVVLMASGSLGLGFDEVIIDQLIRHNNWHIILACGNNNEMFSKFSAKYKQGNVLVLQFYTPVAELYSIADIFLTKPGGMSVTEALSFYLPMVVTSMLPGQEQRNLDFLRRHKLVMPQVPNIIVQIEKELNSGEFKESLKSNDQLKAILNPPLLDFWVYGQFH